MLAMPTVINQTTAIRQSYPLVTVSSHNTVKASSPFATQRAATSSGKLQKSFCFRWSRGSDLRLLRLTMDGLLDKHSGERPRASRIVRVRRLDPMKLGPFAGKVKIDSRGRTQSFLLKYWPLRRCWVREARVS